MATRSTAQQRADDIRVFRAELERLQEEGALTLSDEQRAGVQRHQDALLAEFARSFDIDRDAHAKQLSVGMRVASFLGALAFAAAVFFLFYNFWGLLTETVQVVVLVGASLASFLLTMWMRERDTTGYFTNLCAMVAFACFVLNVFMLGQAFNLTPSDNALVAWAALGFLLAYACDSRLLLAAGILCLIGYISARAGAWRGVYWISFGERPENFLPSAIVIFLVPQFVDHRRYPGFPTIYRVFGLLAFFLPLLVLAFWGSASYLDVDASTLEHGYQVAGFLSSAAVIWLGTRREWPAVFNTGVVFFVVFLYTKFFDWWWETMPKYLFFLVVGLSAILVLFVLRRLRGAASSKEGT
ncbi:MAG: DUF2157 domain-containing protein [Burkholderiales bacterium]